MLKLSHIHSGMDYSYVRNEIMKSNDLILQSVPECYHSHYLIVKNIKTDEKLYILKDYQSNTIVDVTEKLPEKEEIIEKDEIYISY